MRTIRWVAATALLAGCAGKRGAAKGGDDPETCDLAAIGLGAARPIPFWTPPEGCGRVGEPADATIRSEEELRGYFACSDGVSPGIDFTAHQLVLEARELSPAGGIGVMVEDDAAVTRVRYFRPPCPGDPMPMPVTLEVAYLLPAGDPRPIADATCSVGGCP